MNDAEWDDCTEPQKMLTMLRGSGRGSERQYRLCACACVRRWAWHLVADERGRKAVETREGYEDGLVSAAQLKETQLGAWRALTDAVDAQLPTVDAARAAAEAAGMPHPSFVMRFRVAEDRDRGRWFSEPDRMWAEEHERWLERVLELTARPAARPAEEVLTQVGEPPRLKDRPDLSALLRCLFVNPYRPAPSLPPGVLTWHGGLVLTLAQAAYDHRDLPSGHLEPSRLAVLADALAEAGVADADLLKHLRGPGPHVRGCFALDLVLGRG